MKRFWQLLILCLALMPCGAFAGYPEKPITLLVPYTAGGNVDMLARGLAPALEEELGVKIIVTPTPGAGGMVATMKMLQSKPDGYTLLIGNQTIFAMRPFMQKTRFKAGAVTPVCSVALPVHVLGVNKDGAYKTLDDVIAAAKARPGMVSVALLGRGGLHEIMAVMVMRELGIDLKFVPFNSGPEQVTALRGGHVDLIITDNYNPDILPVASFNDDCKAIYPETKSFKEQGYPRLGSLLNVYSLYAPVGTPKEAVERFAQAVRKAVASPQYVTVAENLRVPPDFIDAGQLAERIRSDIALMQELKKSGAIE
ncbi:tripartite tricarboxylate transporter substrate binding protein [Bilophila sp.]|uniref:tripartite tricarboxylate transporter substrate binding protein n=1 Tax=Bilophila sp. TaxID=1929485 RepID=UPI003077660F